MDSFKALTCNICKNCRDKIENQYDEKYEIEINTSIEDEWGEVLDELSKK